MTDHDIDRLYFEWMISLISSSSSGVSYKTLLKKLDTVIFKYTYRLDENRAADGVSLRERFLYERGMPSTIIFRHSECTMLEMIVALAFRCETNIMSNAFVGDRTGQWFWEMIVSLGLGQMYDRNYDEECVDYILERFFSRNYSANGEGGLFTIEDCPDDVRKYEIWVQMCWYLDSL